MDRNVHFINPGDTAFDVIAVIAAIPRDLWAACYHDEVPNEWIPEQESSASIADERSQRGLELLARGELTESAQAFRQAIAADSSHIEAHHGLIRALRDAGQFEAAVAAALALTVLTPMDPLAHTSLSIALQKAGHIAEAEAAAARARILEWKQQLASTAPVMPSEVIG